MKLFTGLTCVLLMSIAIGAHSQEIQTVPVPISSLPPIQHYGFVGGVLTIPFKFHLSDRSMTGGSTLGGYAGWKTSWMGLTTVPVVSAGMAMPTGDYGPGLTVASGFIGSIGQTPLHFGVLVGFDWFNVKSSYPYNGKPWLAVEIGYNFGQ